MRPKAFNSTRDMLENVKFAKKYVPNVSVWLCVCVRERERKIERDRDRERKTDRQTENKSRAV